MNNVLLYIGGLLVAVLAALFAVPHFVDWNGYRGVFEEEASRVLGREVRVGGEVNVRLLPTPYVRFGKVRISDATGGTGEPFFRADEFTLWLSVPPLLKGVLEANRIELDKPALRLAADAQGRGNWTSLGLAQGSLPFAPAGVTLQSVRIRDGSIAFAGPSGAGIARLDGIAGEVEAEALEGPYKFKGTVRWRNGERDVRISTARPDADGTVRLKAVVASTAGNLYTLDGRISALADRSQLDGEITGRIGVDTLQLASAGPAPQAAAAPARPARSGDGAAAPTIELKSTLAADLTAIRLGGITIALENMGQPQLVAGDARITIAESPRIEIGLASRLLDLDALSRRPATSSPIDTAQALMAALMGQLPGDGSVDARFAVDQLTLGGEAVSGFRLALARGAGPLEIRELKAGMPGASRLEISGRLNDGKSAPELDGQLLVRGASLNRFLAWAGKNPRLVEGRTDGPFLVRGQLRLSETAVRLDDATAELSGVPVSGALSHTLEKDRRRIAVELDGQQIDLAQLWPAGPEWLASLLPALADSAKTGAAAAKAGNGPAAEPQATGFDSSTTDLVLRVRAAKLTTGTRRLTDVDADLSVEKGLLKLPRLKLATPEGLDVDVEGEVQDLAGTPRGVLRGVVAARTAAALETLQSALGASTGETARRDQLEGLVPLRLAGRASFGARSARSADIDVDGLVQGGRFVGAWRLDGGWRDWRGARADISLTADSPDVDTLLRYAVGAAGEPARGRKPRPGLLNFKAEGLPAEGMLTSASVRSAGLVLNYDGPLVLKPGLPPAFDGELRVAADQIGEALALAGITIAGAGAAAPVEGVLHAEAKDNVLSLSSRDIVVGTSKIGGHLILAQRTDRPSSLTASLDVGDITVGSLLVPLLDRPAAGAASGVPGAFDPSAGLLAQAAPAGASAGAWPEAPLDFAVLDRIDGTVELRFKRLLLDDGLALSDGRLQARLAPGRVAIEALHGNALGGTATATLALTKGRGAIDLAGSLKLDNLDPARIAPPQAKPAPVSMTLDFAARALSPAALVAGLKGRGQIDFAGGEMRGLTPEAVATVGASLLAGALAPADGAFAAALAEAGTRAAARLPASRVAIDLQDGVMRIAPVTIEPAHGRMTVTSTVDLNTLRFDTEWRLDVQPSAIEAKLAPPPAGAVPAPRPAARNAPALPPVFVAYVGRLAEMATLAPKLSAGALERELAVRKMERDVTELERLRLEDERRRAEEAERQRALEAERAKAAAEAAAAAAQQGAVPGLPGIVAPAAAPAAPSTAPAPQPAAPTTAVEPLPPPAPAPPPPRPAARRSTPADEFMRQLNPN